MKPTLAVRRLLLASTLLAAANSAQAQLYWDTNGTDAGFGTASGTWGIDAFWNTAASGGAGTFSTTTTTSNAVNFGTNTTGNGLDTGTITVNGAVNSGNLTFGSQSGLITLSGGTINFDSGAIITSANISNTITSDITSSGNLEFRSTRASTGNNHITTLGKISNTGNVTFNASGSLNNARTIFRLDGASDYTGNTSLEVGGNTNNNMTVVLGINNALTASTVVSFANTAGLGTGRQMNLDLNGFNQELGGLAATAAEATSSRILRVHNTSNDAAILTINDNDNRLFRGILGSNLVGAGFDITSGNNFSVVKEGTGIWSLQQQTMGGTSPGNTNGVTPRNSYTGGTTVNAGGISFLNPATIPSTGTHTFAAGTILGLGVSGTSAFSATDIDNAYSGNMTGNLAGIVIDATTRIGLDTSLGNATYSADITGSPARDYLLKLGANILTLSGINTYTGATHVNAGALQIDSTTALDGTSRINLGTTTGTTLRFNVNDLTVSAPIHTANAGQTSTLTSRTNTVPTPVTNLGKISGAGNVLFNNLWISTGNLRHTFHLNAASDYTGNTTIDSNNTQNTYLVLGTANALPSTTVLTFANANGDGSGRQMNLNLNGFDQTLAGLEKTTTTGNRLVRVHNTHATHATLTINDNSNLTFFGVLGSDGLNTGFDLNAGNNYSVVKNGTGTWTLGLQAAAGSPNLMTNGITPIHSYTGPTVINAGAIALGADASIASSASLTLGAAGTLDTSAQATYAIPASQPVTFTIDPAGSGSSGRIVADGLDISNAVVTYNALGTLNDSVYVLATYTSLSGEEFDPFPAAPSGYHLNYAYQGNKIALVSDAAGGFASWQSVNGATGGFDDDHDGDGVPNGIEYFLGGPNGNTTGFTALPGIVNNAGSLSITWTQGTGYDGEYGTDFWVETSPSLEANSWTTETLNVSVTDTGNNVTFTFPAPLGSKKFARLKVAGP